MTQYKPSKEDVIRVEAIELPTEDEPEEGLYRWSFRESRLMMDFQTLRRELREYIKPPVFKSQFPVDNILDYLQNFKRCYINLTTGEFSG